MKDRLYRFYISQYAYVKLNLQKLRVYHFDKVQYWKYYIYMIDKIVGVQLILTKILCTVCLVNNRAKAPSEYLLILNKVDVNTR